ncbi:MAG: FAD-dependent oxidoreductase [Xanthobacteraceae bacterium]|nr:FAD-dependent oxidoreductase [Xanthobacteraceae bacterium]
MKRILVLGAGFAGLWSAVGAQKKLRELGVGQAVQVTMVNREPFHNIRVRNYEADLSDVCVPLNRVLEPIGVETIVGEVTEIDPSDHAVTVRTGAGVDRLNYDRLVIALGSEVAKPPVPGLDAFGFDVDTFRAAKKLEDHLMALPSKTSAGRSTVVVVGAGATGIEVAAELPARLAAIFPEGEPCKVILIDRSPDVAPDMGEEARQVIDRALTQLGIQKMAGATVKTIEEDKVRLSNGAVIPTSTVIWCAGMRASPLAGMLGVKCDMLGRLSVDEFMRASDLTDVFAAGDIANAKINAEHGSVMSCQHGRPMGRFAGHNVVADLLQLPMLPLRIDVYSTCVDLGPAGAVYTRGIIRKLLASGAAAKETKNTINRIRIYPPRTGRAADILAAAAPIVQPVPAVGALTPA